MHSTSHTPKTTIRIRGHRKRKVAEWLLSSHRANIHLPGQLPSTDKPVRVVCVSDTHNTRPGLPPGNLLIHAGDLTENGSFDELQAGLTWLSSQPHPHKVFVAGNHDVLLDEAFLSKYPERRYGERRTKDDLDWGDVIYLQDSAITLNFSPHHNDNGEPRRLTVYGTPWTPRYGISAFQFHPDDDSYLDSLDSSEANPDIIVSQGPPRLHLDARDFRRAGCPHLSERVARMRPRLVVFGHIHVAHVREDAVMDGVQRGYEAAVNGWAAGRW
ncbi:Uu.00g044650.m01.CDS01 [Anthostomella pinea]|uniref:Uu.00g044650.m01.CDS01 n=1 Tax=Anthostomella pinea TaxID=933095 RepID=A0AAI8VBP6_9PEZI|nr:Uu.00g044650.m01.CDS01 [Anthostomella pinea]